MIYTARGIVIHENKVLLIYREKNGEVFYSIPGGKVEKGESLEQAVAREILEETTIGVEVEKFLDKFSNKEFTKEQNIFLCKYVSGEPELGNSNEKIKMHKDPTNVFIPKWVGLSEAINLKIRPDTAESFFKNFIKNYIPV